MTERRYNARAALASAAAELADPGTVAAQGLYVLTDPARVPDPLPGAHALPRGATLIHRHFGDAAQKALAGPLAKLARARGFALLIAADPDLAEAVGADGVHAPERLTGEIANWRREGWIMTAAAHGAEGVAAAEAAGADAALLSPVFTTASPGPGKPLGLKCFSCLARAACLPVIALGGVTGTNAVKLKGSGARGLAVISAWFES